MIYLCAGLYAEGPSDYRFLRPLIDRLLGDVLAVCAPGGYDLAETVGIDASEAAQRNRVERVTAAIEQYWETCQIFVIHVDGAGDPAGLRRTCVDVPLDSARATMPEREVVAAACVPVREIEAWMLVDPRPFKLFLGSGFVPSLPAAPESELDPKATLRAVLESRRTRRRTSIPFELFGQNVSLQALNGLASFRGFRGDLTQAVMQIVRQQCGKP